jgi:hypothetical protein
VFFSVVVAATFRWRDGFATLGRLGFRAINSWSVSYWVLIAGHLG